MPDPRRERPRAKAPEPSTDAAYDPARRRRAERTRDEALSQPEVLRRALAEERGRLRAVADRLHDRPISRLVLVGCGDSWYTAIGLRLAFEQLLRVPVEPLQALDHALYYHHLDTPKTVVVGISSSGKTPAVLEALAAARARGALTVGVSNTEGSPLLTQADAALLVRATRAGWPTQATTATMAVLIGWAAELARARGTAAGAQYEAIWSDLEALPELVQRVIARHDAPLQALAEELAAVRWLLYTAAGPHLATAGIGAGKVKELCPIHAQFFPLEEFHHYRSVKPGDPLFLIAPDDASHARALDTAEVGRYDGARVVALVPEGERQISAVARTFALPVVRPGLAPILYSVPLHLFAYHLAIAKFERGLGYPGAFPASLPG